MTVAIRSTQEGEYVDPDSVIKLPTMEGNPVFPSFECHSEDPFLMDINRSSKKWVMIVDEQDQPNMVLNANAFLRATLFGKEAVNPYTYCHRPIIVKDASTQLGKVLSDLKVDPGSEEDDVVKNDLILIWSKEKRVISGTDILGRLLRGIVLCDLGHMRR